MTQLGKIRVLLIRHGQTAWNASGRWQGITQVPLNDVGIAQAQTLAEHLKDRRIRKVIASDLTRASHTAQFIAERHGLKVIEDARWRELNMGVFQGLTYPEILERYPAEAEVMKHDYMGFAAPGGEPRRDLQARAYSAFMDVIADQVEDAGEGTPEIVIVSHGGTIRSLLLKLFDGDEAAHTPLENSSVTIIESDGETHTLIGAALIEHLTTLPGLGTSRRDDT
ncbi:MAG: histidine phosphatase family protein [bacterium]|nr:histidine phosphatase family protein [bacterium]